MDGIILMSRKTYSLSKKLPIIEWIEKKHEIYDFKMPKDFELRFVNANLMMSDIKHVFPELIMSWTDKDKIKNIAEHECCKERNGLTDIVWFSQELQLAYVIRSHVRLPDMFHARSIDEIKDMLGGYDEIRQVA